MAFNLVVVSIFVCVGLSIASPQIDGRIAGGYEARPGQFPYQVAVFINISGAYVPLEDDFCSGSLISPNYVLTAARCLARAEYVTLVLGGPRIDVLEPNQVKVVSSDFIIPENFVSGKFEWDLALIKLNTPVELSDNLQPIKLAEGDDYYYGDVGIVAGWGASWQAQYEVEPVMRWIDSPIISYRQCTNTTPYKGYVVEGANICQYTENLKSACRGDIGAPLVIDGLQVGVGLSVPGNCFRGMPVIYTRVGKYINWVRENSDL